VQSESLGAVNLGLQSTLCELGYVPCILQTDNSSAVTRQGLLISFSLFIGLTHAKQNFISLA
jgi:hypothetical protein